jgi:hypothetical protein
VATADWARDNSVVDWARGGAGPRPECARQTGHWERRFWRLAGDGIERERERERECDVGGGWVIGRKQRTTSGGWWLFRWCWWKLGQHLRRKGVMGQQITVHHVMFCSFSLFFLFSTFYFLNKSKELYLFIDNSILNLYFMASPHLTLYRLKGKKGVERLTALQTRIQVFLNQQCFS